MAGKALFVGFHPGIYQEKFLSRATIQNPFGQELSVSSNHWIYCNAILPLPDLGRLIIRKSLILLTLK
jgi:hypothetical protein